MSALNPPPFHGCAACLEYTQRRRERVLPHAERVARTEGKSTAYIVKRFLLRVHDRHEAGLPL